MRTKTVLWWLAGLVAIVTVMTAGAWSLSAATAFAAEKTADDPADDLPGRYQLPLQAKAADPGTIAPATFTISGMKFLHGRPLKAGEFTFVIREAGAHAVAGGSSLAKQLRSDSVSDAEKYELVAHAGYNYFPNALQPVPDPCTVTNEADGTVAFPALTFTGRTLGETATGRQGGTVFCYTVAEQPPRDANGQLLPGVTKDHYGRYVYQGVTYDDAVKRIYIYAYEKVDANRKSSVALVPLGDATFDAPPVRSQSGIGAGFRNSFGGAFLDDYDGAVYLEGQPIARGEFNFEVHEVTEDGSLLNNQQVPCEAGAGGQHGAEVPVIDDKAFDQPGRFFFAVSQNACAKTVEDRVQLDDTSYVVTVEVTQDGQSGLDAEVTYVRKKPAGSDQWVDVDPQAQPSPMVWENKVAKEQPDEPAAPDEPATPDKPADGDNATTPDNPGDATNPGDEGDSGATDRPAEGENPDKPEAGEGGEGGNTPNHEQGGAAEAKPEAGTPDQGGGSGDQETIGGFQPDSDDDATKITKGDGDKDNAFDPFKAFAQTGDPLFVGIIILIVGVIISAIVLVIAKKRQK